MRGNDEGNPRQFYVNPSKTNPVPRVISAPRARQPREEEMKCVIQYADTRMIHRRSHPPRVAFPVRCRAHPEISDRSQPREGQLHLLLTRRAILKLVADGEAERARLNHRSRERRRIGVYGFAIQTRQAV